MHTSHFRIRYTVHYHLLQTTLGELMNDLKDAQESEDLERLLNIKTLVEAIQLNTAFVDTRGLASLKDSQAGIGGGVGGITGTHTRTWVVGGVAAT